MENKYSSAGVRSATTPGQVLLADGRVIDLVASPAGELEIIVFDGQQSRLVARPKHNQVLYDFWPACAMVSRQASFKEASVKAVSSLASAPARKLNRYIAFFCN
jgi:hypothetical protein